MIYIASISTWDMVPDQANSGPVQGTLTPPGHSTMWTICNPAPGAWFYHCSADMFGPASKDELPPIFQGVGGIWYVWRQMVCMAAL